MKNMIKTVGVLVFNDKGEVLLVTHKDSASHIEGVFGLPAGRIDGGESDVEAAARELKEETGYDASPSDLQELPKEYVADIRRSDGTVRSFSMKVFLCKKYSGESSDEFETIPERIDTTKLGLYVLLPNVKKIIRENEK